MTITLRDVTDADLPIFFGLKRDFTYNHMAAFTHKDPDDRVAFDAHRKKIRSNPELTNRAILFEGQVAGHIASFVIDGNREITYGIARHLWGRVLAKCGFEVTGEDIGFANARGQEIEEFVLRLSRSGRRAEEVES